MNAMHLRRWAILIALVSALPSWGGEPSKEAEPSRNHVDLYGDPLPRGALVRLGSLRFRHPGAVWEVAYSPDGKILAASNDGYNMVILWERATGRKIREIALGARPGFQPKHLRFSADGKRLYACSWYGRDMRPYAWDVESGKDAKGVPPLPGGMRTLGYSADVREMLLLHNEAEIVRWDLEKGQELGRYRKPADRDLSLAALVGERLLVPSFYGESVAMWDVVQEKQLWSVKTSRDKHGTGKPMAFSVDGKLFAVEAPPGAISVYDSVTGRTVHRLEGVDGLECFWISISPDARIVAGGIGDGTWRLWDVQSGRERLRLSSRHLSTRGFYFSPDAKVFAPGGGNNPHAVLQWDTATGKQIDPFPGHAGPVSWVSFSPDGRMAATSSWFRGDPVVRLWDPQSGRLLRSFNPGQAGGVTAVAFSPDGETLAASHWVHWKDETKVRIWNVHTGQELHALKGHLRGTSCLCVAFSPDGKRLASGDNYYDNQGKHGGRLCIWDAKTGKLLREIDRTDGSIQQLLFTQDNQHLLAAADGVHVYHVESGKLVGKPFQTGTRVWRMALSADNRLLATADGLGKRVRLWELATRRKITLPTFNAKGQGVALTPDGRGLAASDSRGNVILFHWPSGQTVGKLSGDRDIGSQVFLSPDARRLATAENHESSALIWDVATLVNQPLPAVAKPTQEDLRNWWEALRDESPTEAYQAVWRFVAVPEQTLPLLAASLRPAKPSQPIDVARLIDDLDSDEFRVRERASRELRKLGDTIEDDLRKARSNRISVEQARRIDQLLASIDVPVFDHERLRETRALAILGQIGGPQARKILAGLTAGAAGEPLTLEAQATLERLKKAGR